MKRTFNYTGRKSLPKSSVTVRLKEGVDGKPSTFTAQFADIEKLGLPPNAPIFVEPYVSGGSVMRFAFGTVSQPSTPVSTSLDEMDAGGRVLFRVKIVDPSSPTGRLLGVATELVSRN
jgi:hypothetical protein